MTLGDNSIHWFSLSAADKLKQQVDNPAIQILQRQLMGEIYSLFDNKIQVSHLQLHHFCQPRQNETMQGKDQFALKNNRTLEPCIKELEYLFFDSPKRERDVCVYLHLADANLDELNYKSPHLYERIKNLVATGKLKIAGGVLDEAFIGPDDVEFSVAAINAFYYKIKDMFGEGAIAPVVWIPERFFEEKTSEIISRVAETNYFFKNKEEIYIIVDQNVIEHSLPEDWKGNVFTGWFNPQFPKLKIFVSSNYLRAIMPQATPAEVNQHFFSMMENIWDDNQKQAVNEFIQRYEDLINRYDYVKHNFSVQGAGELNDECEQFLFDARQKLECLEPLFVFFVDDLEKNGSWPGTYQFAFEENRHFLRYIEQAENMFNPYHMKKLEEHKPTFSEIGTINPSSYKEFSIIWNNEPHKVDRWRELTIKFIRKGLLDIDEVKHLEEQEINELKITRQDIEWYGEFIRQPVSWQDGQLSKYPEIKLNYELSKFFYSELNSNNLNCEHICNSLFDGRSALGNMFHIWNKNRASCPNFIGFFGGASILFFRLHVAFQFASLATLMYDTANLSKTVKIGEEQWTLLKIGDDLRIIDKRGNIVFAYNAQNLHPIVSGFCRHREGYSSILREMISGREDTENFALVEKAGGTTSSHALVTALDLAGVKDIDLAKKTYPADMDVFDNEIEMLGPYPTSLGQVWLMPSDVINRPLKPFIELDMPNIEQIDDAVYQDEFDGGTMFTFVSRVLYCGKEVNIIKKYNTNNSKVTVEIWNRSEGVISFNPVIAFPITLDWYEGDNYNLEGGEFPLNGDVKQFFKDNIYLEDKISNIGLKISSSRNDTKFVCTTMYSAQPSDEGTYSMSPQYEMIALSSLLVISLLPGQDHRIEYTIENNALTSEPLWDVDFDAMPSSLKQKIKDYEESMLNHRGFNNFQRIKLIYARFPEIIFWAKNIQ
ncbi:MAG: hypothetical protein PHF25_03065 [Candidatus Margulisbacteria bacterium]|nr:hypothetical protein [Candidatus Margulisiibacteriota bacterium]